MLSKISMMLSFLLFLVLQSGQLYAETGDLEKYLTHVSAQELFPTADAYGAFIEDAQIAPVLKEGKVIGYAFLNTDFVGAIGYSGKPIKVLIALNMKGLIAGARLVKHSEPIVLAGIPEQKIRNFIDGYRGINILKLAKEKGGEPPPVDIVSGATVTIMVIDDTIKRASVRAARVLGLGGLSAEVKISKAIKTVIPGEMKILDWTSLIGDGSIRRLLLTNGRVNQDFVAQGNPKAAARPEKGAEDDIFIDMYVASLAVPTIARSLLGKWEYRNYLKRIKDGQQAFIVMGRGHYSFRGSGYVRGGIFDRIQVVQGEEAFRFTDHGYKNLGNIEAEGAPDLKEVALFFAPKSAVFNPAEDWQLQLLVQRAIGPLEKVFIGYDLNYQLPAQYIKIEKPAVHQSAQELETQAVNALWMKMWQAKAPEVIILLLAIFLLTILFFAQNQLVKYRALTDRIRLGFLIFTLFYIGYYAQAQLSVVNVFVFVNAMLSGFRWEFFLMEPMIFILWCSVAVSLLFWGRGAYCGWLCPFGALQELTNKIARYFKVPQIRLPWWLHERLWPLKYMIFLGLLGISVYSLSMMEHLAEIEPFKTAIVLKFMRSWPYLLFVAVLIGAGLFIERFYCRYLCPLGAALAIPGKLAMFNWLKRYRNCGDPCHICAQDCMVQAIDPKGSINPNECLHCMGCQETYFDEKVCPVMIHKLTKIRKEGLHKSRKLNKAREIGD
ncbi:Nitrous oxide reductase maturation protein NosR [hydrothermal vent metagenome]|uniref:Nitrous oxide reductase maturation protein NosR n=1 Tax=hydrothermal vent metagenome TaxID=652676 RepID=A0A3B0RBH8_9ZZZZ